MDLQALQDLTKQTNPQYIRQFLAHLDRLHKRPSLSGLFFREGQVMGSAEAAAMGAKVSQIGQNGGFEIQWPVIADIPDVTQPVSPMDISAPTIHEYTDFARLDLGLIRSPFAWCTMTSDINRGEPALVNLHKIEEKAALESHYNKTFEYGWIGRKDTTADQKNVPFGANHFIVRNATEGLTGDVPPGFTTCANLTNDKWKNEVRHYTNITRNDLIEVIREVVLTMGYSRYPLDRGMGFEDVVVGTEHVALCNKVVFLELGNIILSLNNQQRNYFDAAVNGEMVRVAGVPFVYDSYLDNATLFPGNPVYLYDLSTWRVATLGKEGGGKWWYSRTKDFVAGNQPLAEVAYWHSCYTVLCTNRQRNAIVYQK